MMKKATLGVAIASVLTGCGGSSSGGDKSGLTAKSFDLNEYGAISSSSNSLTGTWVAVNTGTQAISEEGYPTINTNLSGRRFFVIREDALGYKVANCVHDGFSYAALSQSNLNTREMGMLKVTNTTSMGGTIHFDESDFGVSITGTISTNMIKISDSVESIGTLNTTLNGQLDSSDVYCVIETSATSSDGDNTASGSQFVTNAGNIAFSSEILNVDGYSNQVIELEYDEWKTAYDDYVQININNQDNYNLSLSFNASGYDGNLSGSLNIQLPRQ